jgi:hypothetical protein
LDAEDSEHSGADAHIQAINRELKSFSRDVPKCILLDPLESMERLMDRRLMYDLLNQCRKYTGGKKSILE